MLRGIGIFLFVVVVSMGLARLERSNAHPAASVEWVRTVDGWEPMGVLSAPDQATKAALHPLLVGGFQLAASVLALVAFSQAGFRRLAPAKRPVSVYSRV